MTAVTLLDGTHVDSADERWRLECQVRHRHVVTMRSLDLSGRRRYVQTVAEREGAEAGKRLQQAYSDDWARRKAAADVAKAAGDQDPRSKP